jgi:hypothetical protein
LTCFPNLFSKQNKIMINPMKDDDKKTHKTENEGENI